YTYDQDGRVTTITTPEGGRRVYTYGPAGPTAIYEEVRLCGPDDHNNASVVPCDRTTRTEYDPVTGQPTKVIGPSGETTILEYDPTTHDLRTVTGPAAGSRTDYSYDAMGRVTTVVGPVVDRVTTTEYDAGGRVARIIHPDQTSTRFTYDLAGRQTAVT